MSARTVTPGIEQLLVARERVELLAASGDAPRRFRMVAYTGAEFDRWYGRAVIDMTGIDGPERLPILLNHDEGQVVGWADRRKVEGGQLVLEGVVSKATDSGRQFAALSDEGFPYTASLGVRVLSREELVEGAVAKVNGREVRGPISIWRLSQLGESSVVTALPADPNTEAHALMSQHAKHLMEQNLPASAGSTPPAAPGPSPETLRAEGQKAEQERLARLRAAIPDRPDFVLEQFAKGHDVLQAKAELADVTARELAELKKAGTADLRRDANLPPAGTPLAFVGRDRESTDKLTTKSKSLEVLSVEEAAEVLMKDGRHRDAFFGDRKVLACYLRAERAGWVPDHVIERATRDLKGVEKLSWGKSGPDYAAITVKGIIGSFFKALEGELEGNWATQLGVVFGSNQETESYKWLGHMAAVREWIGSRIAKGMPGRAFQITNKIFELTTHVDIEDWKFDKTGQIALRISEMGQRFVEHWQKLITDLIETNGTCWDQGAFFATTHNMGGDYTTAQSNLLVAAQVPALNVAVPSRPTRNEMVDIMISLAQHMYTLKDNAGEPYNGGARDFALMVPANMHGAAVAAARDAMINGGESNSAKSQNFTVTPIVNPRLTVATDLFLFRRDSRMKPFILQEAEGVQMSFQGEGSDCAFNKNQYAFGGKAVRNASYGEWAHALKATLS